MTKAHQYIDGVDQVTLIDGVVRFDLIGISQIQDGKVNAHHAGGLAMSIQGFLRMHEQMSRVIDKMVAEGILKKNAPAAEPSSNDLENASGDLLSKGVLRQ